MKSTIGKLKKVKVPATSQLEGSGNVHANSNGNMYASIGNFHARASIGLSFNFGPSSPSNGPPSTSGDTND